MKKKFIVLILVISLLFALGAGTFAASTGFEFSDVPPDAWYAEVIAWCAEKGIVNDTQVVVMSAENATTQHSTADERPVAPSYESSLSSGNTENAMTDVTITVGSNRFFATLYDNEDAQEFLTLLPMTITMEEQNGNEKYFFLSQTLPTKPQQPSQIKAGDLMLYGADCLVLFYETFSSSYSYTKLGYIDDPTGLAAAVGSGNVQVSFAPL